MPLTPMVVVAVVEKQFRVCWQESGQQREAAQTPLPSQQTTREKNPNSAMIASEPQDVVVVVVVVVAAAAAAAAVVAVVAADAVASGVAACDSSVGDACNSPGLATCPWQSCSTHETQIVSRSPHRARHLHRTVRSKSLCMRPAWQMSQGG